MDSITCCLVHLQPPPPGPPRCVIPSWGLLRGCLLMQPTRTSAMSSSCLELFVGRARRARPGLPEPPYFERIRIGQPLSPYAQASRTRPFRSRRKRRKIRKPFPVLVAVAMAHLLCGVRRRGELAICSTCPIRARRHRLGFAGGAVRERQQLRVLMPFAQAVVSCSS
jgi:hypothetical protein